jgi:hypothetical protein
METLKLKKFERDRKFYLILERREKLESVLERVNEWITENPTIKIINLEHNESYVLVWYF